jgi:hypothetical protein
MLAATMRRAGSGCSSVNVPAFLSASPAAKTRPEARKEFPKTHRATQPLVPKYRYDAFCGSFSSSVLQQMPSAPIVVLARSPTPWNTGTFRRFLGRSSW